MIGVALIAAVVLGAAVTARNTLFAGQQWRRMKWRTLLRLRPNCGFASLPELWFRWGRLDAVLRGGRVRPSMPLWRRLFARTTEFSVRLGRAQYFRRLYAFGQLQFLRLAPPRKGKTGALGDRVMGHPGACLVHEPRPDTFHAIAGHRARHGRPVHVWNPEGVGGIPNTFRWAMTAGCADPAEALYRAADLVGAVDGAGDMQWWSEKARGALAAGIHAAGLPPIGLSGTDATAAMAVAAGLQAAQLAGADMGAVWEWAYGDNSLIRSVQGHPGASAPLFGALTELNRQGKASDSVRITMSKSLEWLAVPALRSMVTGPEARPFSVEEWLDRRGTIYMISPGTDESPSAPLFRCFAGYAHRQAKRYAQLQPGRRIDPGVLFAIDELDKCPVDAPSWLADSAGYGIQIDLVVHSKGQLIEKYGQAGFNTIWSTTGVKMFLGGIHDPELLKEVSELCGMMPAGEGREVPCVPIAYLERLPRWRALIVNDDLSQAVVKFRPVWRRTRHRLGLYARPPLLAAPAPGARVVPALNGHAPLPSETIAARPFEPAPAEPAVLASANGHSKSGIR